MDFPSFALGFSLTVGALYALYLLFRRTTIVIEPYQSVLILNWGRCTEELREPGAHFRPALLLPWMRVIRVCRKLDYDVIDDLHVNDRDGTTLRIDLWVEFRVEDARQSVFAVESWKEAMRNLVLHSLMSKACTERLETLLRDRESVAQAILADVRAQALAWGVRIETLHIQDVRLLPEISKRFFDRVSAKLELKKARIEEEGRIRVQTLQAETERKVAKLQAEARSMQPLAVGRAYQSIGQTPQVLAAFQTLYQYSLLQPGKVVSFVGFDQDEISTVEAMMIPDEAAGTRPENVRRMS